MTHSPIDPTLRDAKTGHVPPPLLVQAAEAALGLGDGVERPFIAKGNWLVRQDAMAGLLDYHLRPAHRRIPGLYHTSTFGLYAHWLDVLRGKERWQQHHPIAAPLMNNRRATGRARALYPATGQSLKLATAGSDYADRMQREIAGRREITKLGHLPCPHLYDAGHLTQPAAPWLLEEMVAGRRLRLWRDRVIVQDYILPALTRQTAATRMAARPMADLLPPASPDELPLITRLRAANPHCMTSLCHGDLTAANIAITHTGWTLLDWEWLAPAHPWADMLRLAFKHGHRHPWLLCSISRHAEYLDPAGRNGYIHGIALLVAPIWQKRPALRPHCRSFVEAALSATR